MASRNGWKELVLPCIAMVAVECSTVIATILIKAASVKGMSYFVFTAYCYILGTLVFLLLVSLFKRKSVLPQLKFPLFSRIFLIGLFGFSGQLCMYKGLQLSSPTLASTISNLTPVFTFILAVFFRIEKVAFRSSSSRAKIMGTFTSICGALVIIFYKGPKAFSLSSSAIHQRPLGLMSSESNWIIGGLLLAVAFVLVSLGYIIQSQIMKIYPEEVTVNFFYNLFGTIIFLPICFLAEPNLSSWRLRAPLVCHCIPVRCSWGGNDGDDEVDSEGDSSNSESLSQDSSTSNSETERHLENVKLKSMKKEQESEGIVWSHELLKSQSDAVNRNRLVLKFFTMLEIVVYCCSIL
ncbi:hypothetical protein E1A91_D09G030100v1 [Gossypium mustelinum]|uniref:WAT1-related protein n=1 Tax=Gossypium mustelinum TaxID=34275 RepID=A0A5D2TDW8_GOSMU|nr:hypothetical protein E1A91_D09G030100v1 [Gossypium mustelinum]